MKKTLHFAILAIFGAVLGAFSIASILPEKAIAQTYYPYGSTCYNFTTDLQIGSTGPAVEALHNVLAKEGFYRSNTSYSIQTYTEETASLVSGFQEKYRSEILTPLGYRNGTGFVGSYTRTKLNALYGNYTGNCSGNNDNANVTITVSPQKTNYNLYEDITFSIMARNNSGYEKVLSFNTGCQTSYRIGTYDSASNQICTLAFTSIRIPAYGNYTWTVTHRMSSYNLSAGTYTLTGRVIGYGENSTTIYIGSGTGGGSGSGTNYPRVTRPNSGEWLRRASYETLSWELPSGAYYFQAQAVDVNVIPQYSYGTPYYQDPYYNSYNSNSTCPIGTTCAYTGSSGYNSYQYQQPQYQSQYPTATYSILRNTLLTSYNWYVGSTPSGWSTIPAGSYKLQVCLTGTNLCDLSDSFFSIYN